MNVSLQFNTVLWKESERITFLRRFMVEKVSCAHIAQSPREHIGYFGSEPWYLYFITFMNNSKS